MHLETAMGQCDKNEITIRIIQRMGCQEYSDIFSTIDKQVSITKPYRTILQIRQRLRSGDVPDQAQHGIIVFPEDDNKPNHSSANILLGHPEGRPLQMRPSFCLSS